MYPIASATLALFLRQYRQVVDITMETTSETIHITEKDIIQGGMTVDRYSMSGSKIEIGSAIAGELSIKLDNKDGKFNDITFEGAELFVRLGVKKWDAGRWENATTDYIPIGYFTVDEPPRKLASISLKALDRMVAFDKDFDRDSITFPTTVGELITYCCTKCSIPLKTQVNTLPNYNYSVTVCPDTENLTYRQILQWCGEITATCLYIDYDGKLRLQWYSNTSSMTIDKTVRYTSDLYEKSITITGVKMSDKEKNVYLAGAEDYAFNLVGNELIQHDYLSVVQTVYATVGGFTYLPYTCTAKTLPHLYPFDKISYTDSHGTAHDSIITHWTFKLNGRTTLAAKGETATKNGYASANPLTAREAEILSKMKKANEIELTTRQQAVLALNETIANSLGLFRTGVEQSNGSVVYYYHNAETLEDSSIIYTFREGGFAWTDDWNNGSPVWQYGLERDGNAVLNVLSTYKITTDYLDAGCVTAEKLSVTYRNSVTDAITGAETRVTQSFQAADGLLSSRISEKASQSDLDSLDGRVSTAETSITQNATDIALKASQTDLDALGNTVSSHTTLIQQNADSILLKASQSDLDSLDGRVSTAESSLTVASDRIAMVVNASGIKAASIVSAINDAGSTVKISADHINIDGIISLGSLATTGDIPTSLSDLSNDTGFITSADIPNVPTKTSQLTNDSGYKNYSGVVTVIDGVVTASFVNALGITAGALLVKNSSNYTLLSAGGNSVQIAGWNVDQNSFYSGTTFNNSNAFLCTGSNGTMTIAGHSGTGWVLKAGSNFGVNSSGELYCASGEFSGKVITETGRIGGFDITSSGIEKITTSNAQYGLYGRDTIQILSDGTILTKNETIEYGSAILTRSTQINCNGITVSLSGVELPSAASSRPFMYVVIQGTSHGLYVDETTHTVKVT